MGVNCCERLEILRKELISNYDGDPIFLSSKSQEVLEWAHQVLIYQFQRFGTTDAKEDGQTYRTLEEGVINLSAVVNSYNRSGFPEKVWGIVNSIQTFVILARRTSYDQGHSEVLMGA